MVEIVRNMGEMVQIAETTQNMGGMTSKLRKIWEKWLKLPAIRRKNIRASDWDPRVSSGLCHNDKRTFKTLSNCFYMKGSFFCAVFTARGFNKQCQLCDKYIFPRTNLKILVKNLYSCVRRVQSISPLIYGELLEGLSVKIIHSRGVSKGRRCGQDNPILMSLHSNQIEADKNTMKCADDEAADYELLWQRCSRYQWQWPWLLFLLMLAWCQCSRIVKLLAFMLRVAIWANWQNFRQIWDKTGVDNNLRKFSQQFPSSSAVRGLHCRRTENVFNLRIGRSPTI